MNVLFSGVGRRVELLRAFRAAYKELDLDGRIVAADIDPLAPALREADCAHIVPPLADPDSISTLAEICRREKVGLIFPLIDEGMPVLAAGRRELEETGARLVMVPERALAMTVDKLLTSKLFKRVGVPVPATWLPKEIRRATLAYPVFVKPRSGSASKGAAPARDERELSYFLDYVADPIVQEYLPGPEITNDVVCDFDGNVLSVVSRQRIEVREGEVAKGVTIYDPEITESCVRIAKGLEAIGPITVQCLLRDGRPYFTEVNPRFGGGVPLAIAAGVPVPHWLLAIAAGRSVDVPPLGSYTTGLHITRFDDSYFLSGEDLAEVERIRIPPRKPDGSMTDRLS
jgi:carbamoyl-phosphate synthase large subunit